MFTIRLIYVSKSLDGLVYRDFLALMEQASATNQTLAITGMLCYGSGAFLQVLEGERAVVNALYHHIAADPRHTECQVISVEDIEARDFGEWSMKIEDWDSAELADRRAMMLPGAGASTFAPAEMTATEVLTFLRQLAEAERALLE